jgi:ribosome-associated translation inhibitor RaiA
MNIQFKNLHGGLTPALEERIERKLAKLAKFTDTDEHSANAFFELERAVGSHQSGDVWQVTLDIDVNGARFHAEELADTPRKAAEKVIKEVLAELKKARGKRRALLKREGGLWKSFRERFTREPSRSE